MSQMNFVSGLKCYFDNTENKTCHPVECNNFKPINKEWVVYGVSWCPFCKKTSQFFKEKNINYHYYDVERPPFNTKDNFRSLLNTELNGHHTLPAIFHNNKLIGGYTDLTKLVLN